MVSAAVAKSKAACFSFSALMTMFMASWTSSGGRTSFSSTRTIPIPQFLVSSVMLLCMALFRPALLELTCLKSVRPISFRRVVRASSTTWR